MNSVSRWCRRAALVGFAVAVFLVVDPRPAGAQSQQAPPKAFGEIRFGALTLTPTVALSHIGVDTNVYNANGQPKPDFTFTIGPRYEVLFQTRKLVARATAIADYVYYKTYGDQRGFNPGVLFHADYRLLRRLSLFTDDEYRWVKDRPSVEIDTRSRRRQQQISFGARWALSSKLNADVLARETKQAYDSRAVFEGVALRTTLDQTSRAVSASLGYRLTPFTTIATRFSATSDRFPLTVGRNADWTLAELGCQFKPRAMISGEAWVGQRWFKPLGGQVPAFRGLSLEGQLAWRLREGTSVAASGRRAPQPSFSFATPYYMMDDYQAAIRQALGHRFDFGFTYGYSGLDYKPFAAGTGGTPAAGRDVVRNYTGSVGVLVRGNARVAVYVGRWQRRSGFDTSRNYTGLRTGFMLTFGRFTATAATGGEGAGTGMTTGSVFMNGPRL